MSGAHSRNKGAGYERELVNKLRAFGLKAQRVPLSGATEYAKGDVEVTAGFDDKTIYRGECKRRKSLPVLLDNMEGNDFMALRADHGETLIVLRLPLFMELLQ